MASLGYASPKSINFQAHIKKPDGRRLDAASVDFRFTYLDDLGTCILYSEDFSGVSMSGSGGIVNHELGTGVKSYPSTATTLYDIMSNAPGTSLNCQGGGTLTPTADSRRKVVMQFNYSGSNGWQSLSAVALNSVPYSMYSSESLNALKLGGFDASSYALLDGRVGGQALNGGTASGNNLVLDSTSNSTKGNIILNPAGGKVGIGTSTPATSLDIGSKTDSVRLPAGNTAQRPSAPVNGDIRYNTDSNSVENYSNGVWSLVGQAAAVDSPSSYTQVGLNTGLGSANDQESLYVFGQALTHASSQVATKTLLSGMMTMPFITSASRTVDRLKFLITTAGSAGSKIRIGIYTNKSPTVLYPDALLFDAGEHAGDVTGLVSVTVNVNLPPNTIVWGVFWSNPGGGASYPQMRAVRPDQGQVLNVLGWNGDLTGQATFILTGGDYVTGTSMPATYPAGGARRSDNIPILAMRFQ